MLSNLYKTRTDKMIEIIHAIIYIQGHRTMEYTCYCAERCALEAVMGALEGEHN